MDQPQQSQILIPRGGSVYAGISALGIGSPRFGGGWFNASNDSSFVNVVISGNEAESGAGWYHAAGLYLVHIMGAGSAKMMKLVVE